MVLRFTPDALERYECYIAELSTDYIERKTIYAIALQVVRLAEENNIYGVVVEYIVEKVQVECREVRGRAENSS